jgi:type VI secretion system protein ImpC
MELNFGIVGATAAARKPLAPNAPFRLAVLGDFSGGANKGRLETGDDLARRKPLKVDVDNIDDVIARLDITMSLPMEEGAVEFPIASMDDFHPDQLYEKVELFSAMADLRQRLNSKSGFAAAAKEIAAWRGEKAAPRLAAPKRSRAATVPRGGKLSDFAALIGKPSAHESAADTTVDALLKSVVRPYIVKAPDPKQPELLATLDAALSATMRKILHHPDFQTLESLWRSIDLLTRRLETDSHLQIVLYDISAEELAADLSSQDNLEETGLFKLLVEQPSLDAHQGALSAFIGAYTFDHTPPQAELLGRVAKIAGRAKAPFIAAIGPDFLKTKPEDIHPLIKEAWNGLAALPEAVHLALVTPGFLLRQPYGDRTDSIDSFEFEEFTPQSGLKGMLWGNPAFVAGLLLGTTAKKQGAKMNLGSIMAIDDIPYYFYVDEEGDQTALPCTERLMSERVAALVRGQGFLPLLSIKGRPEVRLGGFNSLAGPAIVGPWPAPTGAKFERREVEAELGGYATTSLPKVVDTKEGSDDEAAEEGGGEEEAAEEGAEASGGEEAEAEAPAEETTGSGDPELDALLASLDDTPAEAPADAPAEEAPAEEGGEAAAEDGMDPELAELLKGL